MLVKSSTKFRDQLKAAAAGDAPAVGGFNLHRPTTVRYADLDGFYAAVKDQSDSVGIINADSVRGVDIDGKIKGTNYTLTHAAFGDLCHWSGMPRSFIQNLAKIDEALALEVVETQIQHVFRPGVRKSLFIDSRTGSVEGIVGTETYSPLSNLEALKYSLSASGELHLSNGFLSGPNMRLTVISETKHEAKKGDIVRFGVSLANSIHGDCSLKVSDYSERLVCTNGAVATDDMHSVEIIHRGDIEYNTQKAIVASSLRSEAILPVMRYAAAHLMMPTEIKSFGLFTRDSKNGGNDSLWTSVKNNAMQEAQNEGRDREEVTLWGFVNGITQAAHDTKSLNRKTELEAMGYKSLVRFGSILSE